MSEPQHIELQVSDTLAAYRDHAAAAALPPLRIVHLSDLHFVTNRILKRFGFYRGLSGHDPDTRDALKNAVRSLNPDLLFVTGDHTTWGDRASLSAARAFIVKLGEEADMPEGRIFWVPGNHDILLHYYSPIPTSRRNCDLVFGETQVVRLLDIAGFKLAIFSFDSTLERKGQRSLLWPMMGSRGRISRRSFNSFNEALQEVPDLKDRFKIAQVHHHPLPVPYKRGDKVDLELTTMSNGGTFIAYMQESGVNLILHGHEHIPYSCRYCYDLQGKDIIVAAAGTSCQKGELQNSFNYIEVVPGLHIAVRQYRYTEVGFQIDRGTAQAFPLDGHS